MTHFDFGVKGQGHIVTMNVNVSQGPGKGGICVIRHFLFTIYFVVLKQKLFLFGVCEWACDGRIIYTSIKE